MKDLNVILQLFFWALSSALLAWLLWITQKRFIMGLGYQEPPRVLTLALLISALRILLTVIVLFLAFKQGLSNGLASLFSFILMRWILMGLSLKNNQPHAGDG